MEMKPAMVAIAAFIVITVIAAVLMPVLGDATKTNDTLVNNGYYRMSELDLDETHTISWTYEAPTTLTVDGTAVALDAALFPDGASKSVILTESYLVRLFGHGTYYTLELWDGGYEASVSSASSETVTITFSSGSLVWTPGTGDAVTKSVTDYLITVDPAGDMIMKGATDKAYMLPDSKLYAAGISTFATGTFGGLFITGNVEGVTITSPLSGVTVNNDVVIVATNNNKYVDLVDLEKITFSTTYSGTTVDQTYSYFVVPYEVTAEKAVRLSANENAILLVIPALLIIAILIGILAVAFRMRE